MSKKISRFLAVAVASLAVSIGAAHAAPTDGPGGPGGHGGPGGMHGHFMKDIQQLHNQLNLTADQEKLWQSALDTMKQNRQAEHATHEQMKDQFKAVQQQPILDLNAMNAAHQKIEAQDQQLREQTTAAWLNFYNSLNDKQKTTVSTSLKQHWAKMEARHMKMRDRWEHHGKGPASAPVAQ